MILDLHRQGLSLTAVARRLGIDCKTVREYIARGLEPPSYRSQPRRPRCTDGFLAYLCEHVAAYPALTAVRLWRELGERGFSDGYTAVKRAVQEIRPNQPRRFEARFETPPGEQAQVDLAASMWRLPMSRVRRGWSPGHGFAALRCAVVRRSR